MDNKTLQKISSFKLYKKYSRKEVHAIFADGTRYAEGGGVWGRAGVVEPKASDGIFVLFCVVKSRMAVASAQFIEPNGKFHWVSQPSMDPHHPKFIKLIAAGKAESAVLLFAKPSSGPLYSYLGTLSYVSHDSLSSKPVLVEWKITPWPLPALEADTFIIKRHQ